MKKAFTMIELIFVIVILGILAAVALPRIMATRDDAKISAISSDIMTAVSDIANHAMAYKIEDNLSLMSNVIRDYESRGIADVTLTDETTTPPINSSVDITVGDVPDCIILSIVDKGDTKIIEASYGSTGDTGLCATLQRVIKEKAYPMKLEGKGVSY